MDEALSIATGKKSAIPTRPNLPLGTRFHEPYTDPSGWCNRRRTSTRFRNHVPPCPLSRLPGGLFTVFS